MAKSFFHTWSTWDSAERLAILLGAALLLLSIASINYWSVNFPNSDDYSAIVEPLIKSKIAASPLDRISPFFEPHTQHRQILLRIVAGITTAFDGTIRFDALIFLGSLFFIPLLLALASIPDKFSPHYFFLSACILCQPQFAEATQWATNSVPYLWINIFALASLLFISMPDRRLYPLAIGSALLSICSWGNGIFIPFLMLLTPNAKGRRTNAALALLCLAAIVFALLNRNTHQALDLNFATVVQIAEYFIRLVGCAPGYLSAPGATLWGTLLLALWLAHGALALRREGRAAVGPLFLFELFVLGSQAACAFFRVVEGPATAFATSRYTLQSALFIACLLIRLFGAAEGTRHARKAHGALTTLAVLWAIYANLTYYSLYRVRHDLLQDSKLRWACFQDGLAGLGWQELPKVYVQAENLGLLKKLSAADCSGNFAQPAEESEVSGKSEAIVARVEYYFEASSLLHLSGYAFRAHDDTWNGDYELILKSDKRRYRAPLETRIRPDVSSHVTLERAALHPATLELDHSGFSGFIKLNPLPPGSYQLFLGIQNGGRRSWTPLNRQILR